VAKELLFLRNMSTINHEHRFFQEIAHNLKTNCNVDLELTQQHIDIWSYTRLATEFNFVGCEILMIDAEGYDASILRSVIQHCRQDQKAWPHLIMFETMGHCDALEGPGTEWSVIAELKQEGYLLVSYSCANTYLVWADAFRQKQVLQDWASEWKCLNCSQDGRNERVFPFVDHHGIWCGLRMENSRKTTITQADAESESTEPEAAAAPAEPQTQVQPTQP